VAITPDGKQAVSASGDNTLKLWDLATGSERATLNGHRGWVTAVAITPDGKQAVSASWYNTLKLWDLATGEVVASFGGDGALRSCAIAPDGVTVVAGEWSGRVHFLRLEGLEKGGK
jgi:WD40 repeat protein